MDHVDLAMVLAVDGSASVTYQEFGLIAGGMAAAVDQVGKVLAEHFPRADKPANELPDGPIEL